MDFLADMGISMRTVEWLRKKGHQIKHLREESLQKLPDDQIIIKAKAENKIIITCDLDFGHLLAQSSEKFPSVIILRFENQKSDNQILKISEVIKTEALSLLNGAIISITESKYRVRHTPIKK